MEVTLRCRAEYAESIRSIDRAVHFRGRPDVQPADLVIGAITLHSRVLTSIPPDNVPCGSYGTPRFFLMALRDTNVRDQC